MDGAFGRTLRQIGYTRARQLVLAAGLAVLLLTAGVMYARGVDRTEVVATLLFTPVFIGVVFWNVAGGLAAAALASLAYLGLRYPAIQAIGAGRFTGLILSRAVAYLAFGAIGGWANRQLAASLTKLELYDQIDDTTGLHNARFFLQDTDLEVSRARRYQTLFSIAMVDIPTAALDVLARRQRAGALREIGRMLRESVRTVDRAVHATDGRRHRIAVILPETAAEGAGIFVSRLADRLAEYLAKRGASVDRGGINASTVTYPGDEEALQRLREEFAVIDRAEHPEDFEATPPRPAGGRAEGAPGGA